MSIDKIVYKSWISYNLVVKEKCLLVMKRFIKFLNVKVGYFFYNCRICNCLCIMIVRDSILFFLECRTIYVSYIFFEFKSVYI